MPPEYLYKYMPVLAKDVCELDRKNRQLRYDAVFTQNRLYFSHPTDFNDPMDSRPYFTFSGNAEQLQDLRRKVIWQKVSRENPSLPGGELLHKVAQYQDEFPGVGDEGFDVFIQKSVTEYVQDVGILCLSETGSCPVMFYHYADAHAGVCMRFRADSGYFASAERVSYGASYPEIDYYAEDDGSEFDTIFLKKYESWRYEREWRVVDFSSKYPDKKSRLLEYDSTLLDAIIFGYLMSNEEKNRIARLLKSANRTVSLLHAKLKPKSFELEVVPWPDAVL